MNSFSDCKNENINYFCITKSYFLSLIPGPFYTVIKIELVAVAIIKPFMYANTEYIYNHPSNHGGEGKTNKYIHPINLKCDFILLLEDTKYAKGNLFSSIPLGQEIC